MEKIVVIKKKTQLEELLRRHATTSQVKFFLESRGESYDYYKDAHRDYRQGLEQTLAAIPATMRSQVVDKDHLGTFQFCEKDLVVVVGDPGLLVNVAKYVGHQPVIAVNPDQERFDDIFTTCFPDTFAIVLAKALDREIEVEKLTMAEASLDDGQKMYALNDLFIGQRTHVSARYVIAYNNHSERQSSSGIIVSTGTGSTGWMTSIVTGANAIALGEDEVNDEVPFPRDADYLMFAVREPFPSKMTKTGIVYGKVTQRTPLRITSNMPENGVIFSDGIEADYLEFNAGKTVTIYPSQKKVYLIRGNR